MAKGFEAELNQANSSELQNSRPQDASSRQLDSYSVLHEAQEGSFNAAPEAGKLESLLASNEAAIYAQMASITERLSALSPSAKAHLVSSFAPHQTGADYPLYDAIRKGVTTTA